MRFGDMLRLKRLQMGWTQQQLGDRIGRTKNNISQFENGKREPSFGQLLLFSQIFGVSVDTMLHGAHTVSPRLAEPMRDWTPLAEEPVAVRLFPVYDSVPLHQVVELRGTDARNAFYFPAPSDEMSDARIETGDFLLVRKLDQVVEGRVLLLTFDKHTHMRIIQRAPDGRLRLIARSARHKDILRAESRVHVLGEILHCEIDPNKNGSGEILSDTKET